uniref:Uncharacterized protein AlNc14C132G6997 n=1 Tax=Albugo laibachii Nc14 TaxID=890382 RepID=F0WKE5_9STRA|nr:conserved hypothetical protein [Albugo laibachii Nc14]|eukprot:CCA21749.1 conserved hypothetical protein [Albugo laibachii Nc14]
MEAHIMEETLKVTNELIESVTNITKATSVKDEIERLHNGMSKVEPYITHRAMNLNSNPLATVSSVLKDPQKTVPRVSMVPGALSAESTDKNMKVHRLTDAAAKHESWMEVDGDDQDRDESDEDEEEEPYSMKWEFGSLGIIFKTNSSGKAIIRKVNRKGNANGLQFARVGDTLIAMNDTSTDEMSYAAIMDALRTPVLPIILHFLPISITHSDGSEKGSVSKNQQRSTSTTIPEDMPSTSTSEQLSSDLLSMASKDGSVNVDLPKLEEDEFDVVWDRGPLGCGLKQRRSLPVVKSVTGAAKSSSVMQIRSGDFLLMINGFQTGEIGFKETVKLLQTASKPVYLRFRRRKPSEKPTSAQEFASQHHSNVADYHTPPVQYTVNWKEGPLGIQIKARADGFVYVSKFTGLEGKTSSVSSKIAIGDVFLFIGNVEIKNIGIAAAFQLLRTVAKPVDLVFERPTTQALIAHQRHTFGDSNSRKPCSIDAGRGSWAGAGSGTHRRYDSSESETPRVLQTAPLPSKQDEAHLGTQLVPDKHRLGLKSASPISPPRFSDLLSGSVATKSVKQLPPPPAYAEIFTKDGQWRRSGQINTFSMLPMQNDQAQHSNDDDHDVVDKQGRMGPNDLRHHDKYYFLRQQYLEAERERNMGPSNSAHRGPSFLTSYSDIDDSEIMTAAIMRQRTANTLMQSKVPPPVTSIPQLWIRWSDGPLGVTFKRFEGRIVLSRLTGMGFSEGLNQLSPGDWLVSINDVDTRSMKLSDTMKLLKSVTKPVEMCFVLQ